MHTFQRFDSYYALVHTFSGLISRLLAKRGFNGESNAFNINISNQLHSSLYTGFTVFSRKYAIILGFHSVINQNLLGNDSI